MAKSTNPGTLPLPTPLPLFPPNRRKKWLEFREDFYDYALSNGIFGQTPEVQISHFRTALGPQCKSKLRALKVTVANNSVDVIKLAAESNIPSPLLESTVKAWEKEYCGKQNVLVVREKFYACNQGSIDFERFLEKVCELAEDCEFPTEVKDEMIRDRLVLGLDSDRLKDRVIQNDKNDLRSVIEVLRRSSRSLPMISTTAEISGAVKEEAVHKYLRMPQGLNISPEIYQAKQMQALENLRGIEIIADDILIHGETFEDHLMNLRGFFQRCRERNLRLNRSKLRLCVPQAKYMGHILSRNGVQPDPEKIKVIQESKAPTDKKGLLRLLGATNYLSRFIPKYSELTTPLRSLLKDSAEFAWQKDQDKAFADLKYALTHAPGGKPVELCSSALRPAEVNYAVIEKELLAIVVACKKFDHFIFGHSQVVVETDHQPLIGCFNRPLHSNPKRLQRMLLAIQKYSLEVRHVKGKANCLADWLSRDTLRGHHTVVHEDNLIYRIELEELNTTALSAPRQPKEKLSLTPDATYPFQIIYQDLFTHSGKQYLVTVDVYSDYFEIDDLGADTTAERLVRATQKHFSRYGAPMELHSDNGPQFTSATFQDFLASWGTVHVTSSPYFPQSNGKAEAAVKVAKGLLKKCKINGEEYEYALLELRNTIQSDGLSRAQKFFSRPLRSKLPSRMDSNFIFDENLVKNNESKRKKVK
ncbi:uncharacterized protein K02A2.6-like [Galendromus occidentalis]|uniref:RNA-directed DNA polymerase n=1 Tax=Galendromus occidentalis TaxID=34638 RepID=A0AAJ7PAU7_9ACAR|nr:uncharacterized protein K02A2.6-like [Galendromus occidentalis]